MPLRMGIRACHNGVRHSEALSLLVRLEAAYASTEAAYAACKERTLLQAVIYVEIVLDSAFSRLFSFLLSLCLENPKLLCSFSIFSPQCLALQSLGVLDRVLLLPTRLRRRICRH